MITIKEMKTKQELTQFVKFPFSLYDKSSNWVPPLINDELESMDPEKNPVFRTPLKNPEEKKLSFGGAFFVSEHHF